MSSNLPPGCNSDDGGIDHELESALEQLCDQITDPTVARALTALGPDRIVSATAHAEKAGYDAICALTAFPDLLRHSRHYFVPRDGGDSRFCSTCGGHITHIMHRRADAQARKED